MRKLTMPELGRQSKDEFLRAPKHKIVLVLDNIRSGLNVGSIFRTADAFSLEQIILCGITPQPPHREILKTALGATESVSWRFVADPDQAVRSLLENGYKVMPVEQTDRSTSLAGMAWDSAVPCAFVFGNEVDGVSDSVLTLLDESIEIPQSGTKHSLNVAVSVGIVVWHALYGRR
jgi:tRNA G18 (ribose-2'-O)-methylase SpoU